MKKNNFLILILALFTLSIKFCYAQKQSYNPPKTLDQQNSGIQGALQEIMLKQTKITRKDYDNFWQKVGINSPQEKEMAIASIKKNFITMQEYNREIWNCAEQAWYKSQVIKCSKADAIMNKFKEDNAMKDQGDLIKLIESSYQNIITAAATKQELTGKDGTKMGKLDLATIQASRKTVDDSLKKFDRILAVNFVEE